MFSDDSLKMQNSLESGKSKVQMFKGLYEKHQRELLALTEKYNNVLEENLHLQSKIDIFQNDHE